MQIELCTTKVIDPLYKRDPVINIKTTQVG